MTTMRVIVDEGATASTGLGTRHAEELTRQLIATAPTGSTVAAVVSASPGFDDAGLRDRIPGLVEVHQTSLARRELAAAWQHGFTRLPGSGTVHATSLLAPLSRHDRIDRLSSQVVVTIRDAMAWTDPEVLSSREVSWTRGMTRRAERYADAVVVPTHAVAGELAERFDFGDRIRVIGEAASSRRSLGVDEAQDRRSRLGLAPDYLLTVPGVDPRAGLDALIASLALVPDIPLIIVAFGSVDESAVVSAASDAGVDPERLVILPLADDHDLAAVLDGATVFVLPTRIDGNAIGIIEALAFGLPIIHSDAPALVEVAADAGIAVTRDDADGYPERLAEAIIGVLDDSSLRDRLAVAATDRSIAYSWRDSAEKVWQLHADL